MARHRNNDARAKRVPAFAGAVILALFTAATIAAQSAPPADNGQVVTVRPSSLASIIEEIAGRNVRVRNARVVGVFNPRAFLIETASLTPSMLGMRNRILVLVDQAALRVRPAMVVGSNVVVLGTARTVLGMQVTSEVPWPSELTGDNLKRLEVRGAVLARSVQTAEGVELTDRQTTSSRDR